jgi:hypothetical protein
LIKKNILIIFLIFNSCTSHERPFSGEVHKSESISEDIQIPKVIFDTIYKNIRAESSSAEPVYLFQPLEVVVESKSTAVMGSHKYIFANGGGRIDLKSIIKGQGSFYFYFPEEQFTKLPELENLYYISDYPKAMIDGETFGIGCSSWVDLKKKFSQMTQPHKIILNTTAQRYLYVVGGYYVFVFRKGNQVYLSHLYLADSSYENLKCPTKNVSTNEN